jgi:hypothetical protein
MAGGSVLYALSVTGQQRLAIIPPLVTLNILRQTVWFK